MRLERGVMQGDPLSPLLFNTTLDQVLSSQPQNVAVELGGRTHGYLSLADDVVLLASTKIGLETSMRALTSAIALSLSSAPYDRAVAPPSKERPNNQSNIDRR